MTEFQPLPPKALLLMRVRSGVVVGFVAAVLVAFAVVALLNEFPGVGVVSAVVAVAAVAGWWVLVGLVFRSYGWRLTDGTVELRHGVIVKRHAVLPRTRVQNVTVVAGPLARALGLATVTVHSAGANTPNIQLPDVSTEVGDWLRASLLPAARV